MRTITRFFLAVSFVGTTALAAMTPVNAQYYQPPPDYGYGYGYHYRTWNGCPPYWTIQGGVCKPYQGPVGGGWSTWNGCPPMYTIQGGVCKPYQGPIYGAGRWGYYR
jgi:hypothetical protein